jgi:hypothetical protein
MCMHIHICSAPHMHVCTCWHVCKEHAHTRAHTHTHTNHVRTNQQHCSNFPPPPAKMSTDMVTVGAQACDNDNQFCQQTYYGKILNWKKLAN